MVLAGLIAAQKVLGKSLADHTFLFLGAGEVRPENIYVPNKAFYIVRFVLLMLFFFKSLQAGTGIAELIALKISKEVR